MEVFQHSKALSALTKAIKASATLQEALIELKIVLADQNEGHQAAKEHRPQQENAQRYQIPDNAKSHRCKGCNARIYFVGTANGKSMPVEQDGYPHWERCSDPAQFRKE